VETSSSSSSTRLRHLRTLQGQLLRIEGTHKTLEEGSRQHFHEEGWLQPVVDSTIAPGSPTQAIAKSQAHVLMQERCFRLI
jgi:hypothetical protein